MKDNFEKGFKVVTGLEGLEITNDLNDPGGLTICGLSKRYNPEIFVGMTFEAIKNIYYVKYWKATGCDDAEDKWDICLFDGAVNPQNDPSLPFSGNKEILVQNPLTWQDFLFLRMIRYMHNSKREYVLGHLQRILKLYQQLI